MIDPEDELLPDDSDDLDKEDQLSQQDIHGTGIDADLEELEEGKKADTDLLQQSFDASEASFTLKLDDAPPKNKDDKKK